MTDYTSSLPRALSNAAMRAASTLVQLTAAEKKLLAFVASKRDTLRMAEEAKRLEKAFRHQVVQKKAETLQLGNRLDEHLEEELRRRERKRVAEEEARAKARERELQARLGPRFSVADAVQHTGEVQQDVQQGVQQDEEEGSTTPPLPPVGSTSPSLPPPPSPSLSRAPVLSRATQNRQQFQKLMQEAINKDNHSSAAATAAAAAASSSSSSSFVPPPPPPPTAQRPSGPSIKKRALRLDEEEDTHTHALSHTQEQREEDQVSTGVWNSRREPRNQRYALPACSLSGKNTVVLKLSLPFDASWSVNISPKDDFHTSDVLFHFNPRNNDRVIVLNDRQGTWGDFVKRRVDVKDQLVRDVTLKIHITPEGFYVFADNRYRAFFVHRRDFRDYEGQDLQAWFSFRDTNGNPHSVTVRKVLWTHTDLAVFERSLSQSTRDEVLRMLSEPPPRSVREPMPPRTVLLSGLPVMEDLKVLFGIELNLFRAFEGVVESISFLPGTSYGFARLKDPTKVAEFISEFDELVVNSRDGEHTIRMRPMVALAPSVSLSTESTDNGMSTTPDFAPPEEGIASAAHIVSVRETEGDESEPPAKRSKYDVHEDELCTVHVVEGETESLTPLLPPPPSLSPSLSPTGPPPVAAVAEGEAMDVASQTPPFPPSDGETESAPHAAEEEKEEEKKEQQEGEEEEDHYMDLY